MKYMECEYGFFYYLGEIVAGAAISIFIVLLAVAISDIFRDFLE